LGRNRMGLWVAHQPRDINRGAILTDVRVSFISLPRDFGQAGKRLNVRFPARPRDVPCRGGRGFRQDFFGYFLSRKESNTLHGSGNRCKRRDLEHSRDETPMDVVPFFARPKKGTKERAPKSPPASAVARAKAGRERTY